MATLYFSRFGAEGEERYDSIADAAKAAVHAIEYNLCYPLKIADEGGTVWENGGLESDNSDDVLHQLAGVNCDHA